MKHSDIYNKIYPSRKKNSNNPSNAQEKADGLKSRLGKYAAISTALVAVGSPNLDAAITHTTVSHTLVAPSASGSVNGTGIDIDQDGNNDFSISAFRTNNGDYGVGMYPAFTNSATAFLGSTGMTSVFEVALGASFPQKRIFPYLLANQAMVSAGPQFQSFPGTNTFQTFLGAPPNTTNTFYRTFATFNGTNTRGNFLATPQEGFVGIRIQKPDGFHYGWVHIIVDSEKQVRVLEFAYETTPNTPIQINQRANIPTLSEWGLITLAVLLLTFGTLYIGRREEILATQTSEGKQFKMGYSWQKSPFEWAVFWKSLLATAGLAAVAGALSWFTYGSIATVDIVGTAIAGPIFAYLMHLLWIFERDND